MQVSHFDDAKKVGTPLEIAALSLQHPPDREDNKKKSPSSTRKKQEMLPTIHRYTQVDHSHKSPAAVLVSAPSDSYPVLPASICFGNPPRPAPPTLCYRANREPLCT